MFLTYLVEWMFLKVQQLAKIKIEKFIKIQKLVTAPCINIWYFKLFGNYIKYRSYSKEFHKQPG